MNKQAPGREKEKAVFCWSGGKDSAMALHLILSEKRYEIVALLTTFNRAHKRNSMHGVREVLIEEQAASIGLPLEKVWVTAGTNLEYEQVLSEKLSFLKAEMDIRAVIYGDIFLEDLRAYREQQLVSLSLTAVFPLWKRDTEVLLLEICKLGFETITCCVSTEWLDDSFLGKKIDAAFMNRLPAGVDPCGENGEFHSFCYKGPVFSREIIFRMGERIFRPLGEKAATVELGFLYIDLLPDVAVA
jgi:uncharacterized protein (TIGR00290 family)